MNLKRLSVLSLFPLLVTFAFTTVVAAQRPDGDLSNTNWTASTQYVNRNLTPDGALIRLYFPSAQGNYNSNDYWWSSDFCDLNAGSSCNLTVNLNDRTRWTNLCGQSATDITPQPGPN